MSFSVLCLTVFPFYGLLKGMQMDIPFVINTPLHEVTFVLAKALLEFSTLL